MTTMTPEQRAKALYDRLFRLGQFRGSAVVTDPLAEIARVIREAENARIGKLVGVLRATHQHIDKQFGEHDTTVEAMAAAGASGAIEELADRLERGMLGGKEPVT